MSTDSKVHIDQRTAAEMFSIFVAECDYESRKICCELPRKSKPRQTYHSKASTKKSSEVSLCRDSFVRSLAERAGQLASGTEEQANDKGDAVVQSLQSQKKIIIVCHRKGRWAGTLKACG